MNPLHHPANRRSSASSGAFNTGGNRSHSSSNASNRTSFTAGAGFSPFAAIAATPSRLMHADMSDGHVATRGGSFDGPPLTATRGSSFDHGLVTTRASSFDLPRPSIAISSNASALAQAVAAVSPPNAGALRYAHSTTYSKARSERTDASSRRSSASEESFEPSPYSSGVPIKTKRKLRKNNRERQRRSELNDKFDELSDLLRLGSTSAIGGGKVEKFSVLSEAVTTINTLRKEAFELRSEKAELRAEIMKLSTALTQHAHAALTPSMNAAAMMSGSGASVAALSPKTGLPFPTMAAISVSGGGGSGMSVGSPLNALQFAASAFPFGVNLPSPSSNGGGFVSHPMSPAAAAMSVGGAQQAFTFTTTGTALTAAAAAAQAVTAASHLNSSGGPVPGMLHRRGASKFASTGSFGMPFHATMGMPVKVEHNLGMQVGGVGGGGSGNTPTNAMQVAQAQQVTIQQQQQQIQAQQAQIQAQQQMQQQFQQQQMQQQQLQQNQQQMNGMMINNNNNNNNNNQNSNNNLHHRSSLSNNSALGGGGGGPMFTVPSTPSFDPLGGGGGNDAMMGSGQNNNNSNSMMNGTNSGGQRGSLSEMMNASNPGGGGRGSLAGPMFGNIFSQQGTNNSQNVNSQSNFPQQPQTPLPSHVRPNPNRDLNGVGGGNSSQQNNNGGNTYMQSNSTSSSARNSAIFSGAGSAPYDIVLGSSPHHNHHSSTNLLENIGEVGSSGGGTDMFFKMIDAEEVTFEQDFS